MRPVPAAAASAAALAAALLAGCAAPDPQAPPPTSTYAASLSALVDKADAIALDTCTTRPAVQAYPDCARYVAEVGNLALAAQGAPGGTPALTATARSPADRVGRFSRTGCVAVPGVAGPPAATCGDALAGIQNDLKTLRAELDALPSH